MSTYLISPEFILFIRIASIIGFLFLGGYTLYSYLKIKNSTLLFISLAFFVIALSIILRVTVIPIIEESYEEPEIVEAMFEGIQFIAAFFFFVGLRIIKKSKEGEE